MPSWQTQLPAFAWRLRTLCVNLPLPPCMAAAPAAALCPPVHCPPASPVLAALQQPRLARYLEKEAGQQGGSAGAAPEADGWVEMPGVDPATTFLSKPIKPLILATGRAVCLYKARAWLCACACMACHVAGQSAGVVAGFVACPQLLASQPRCPTPLAPPTPLQVEDTIYATDANSTAYKYPLADANILSVKGKPAGACA